ncbi:HesA/MoeB/ThiF family protein [Paenalcaligenes suwonensis]|uniref:HesA/MoeB/ThiF family protein n=1 Tax=Paenalcaligenes suwonensis TaxID=1202713 RepID=UPI00140A873E|nr:molybdopterin-synthase adenylyltransferase MoeB [Paenalcaligenes suwonensis]NHC60846.1 molybdopterin-synthase adenylyltransferase MoeB [Paenalcaligenes suwonensis]
MNDQHLMRYARHILLNEFGVEAQERIVSSHALIVGAGGLGSPAAFYLAAAGVGTLTLVDDDEVELSNLQRQILHTTDRIGMPKAESAKQSLAALNPSIEINTVCQRLDEDALQPLVMAADIVLDCTDNFATRHAINRSCVRHHKPLVSGAGIRFSGQISVYDLRDTTAPCYSCLFPEADDVEELRCATTGVFGPVVGTVGCMQAAEALKVLGNFGEPLVGRLLSFDALTAKWHSIRFKKDPGCEVCGQSS